MGKHCVASAFARFYTHLRLALETAAGCAFATCDVAAAAAAAAAAVVSVPPVSSYTCAAAATAATAAATTQEEREMRAHIPAHTHCCKSVRAHGWQLLVVGHFVFRHPRFRDPDPPPPVKFITRLLYRRCILSATLCA
jgi:hypothetical protein